MNLLQTVVKVWVVSALVILAPLASAHAKLIASDPKPGSTVHAAQAEITLTFNEKIEQAFSSMSITGSDGAVASTEKPKVDVANPVVLRLKMPQLHPGAYSVKWAVAGHDGHRRTGTFAFSVK